LFLCRKVFQSPNDRPDEDQDGRNGNYLQYARSAQSHGLRPGTRYLAHACSHDWPGGALKPVRLAAMSSNESFAWSNGDRSRVKRFLMLSSISRRRHNVSVV